MNGLYFKYYYPGKFENQEILCQILRDNDDPKYEIETFECNPLTIRLLVAHDNLEELIDFEQNLCQGQDIIINDTPLGPVYVSGASQCEIINLQSQEKQKLKMIDVHKGLFGFFSNLGAVLDRVALEIGILYDYVSHPNLRFRIDWNYFFGNTPKIKLLTYCADKSDIKWAVKCRNRLVHDGIIKVDRNNNSFYLPDEPDNERSTFSKHAIKDCKKAFWETVDTIDKIYGDLSKEICSKNLPLK